jgi:hypothetical protein
MLRCGMAICAGSDLVGGEGLDCKSVNVRAHQVTHDLVDESVAGDSALACEGAGNDRHPEVTPPVSRPGMTGMEMTLVLDFEEFGSKALHQPFSDLGDSRFVHGSVQLRLGCRARMARYGRTRQNPPAEPAAAADSRGGNPHRGRGHHRLSDGFFLCLWLGHG